MLLLLLQLSAPPPCPSAEAVRALRRGVPAPSEWIAIYLTNDCSGTRVPELWERIGKDPATLARVAHMLRGRGLDSTLRLPNLAWRALKWVSDVGPATGLDIMLRYSVRAPANIEEQARFGWTFEFALVGLVRYAPTSSVARRRIEQHLHSDNPGVRQAAFHALLYVSNAWSRTLAAEVPERDLAFYDRLLRTAVLAEPACPAGTFWSEWHGVEGQVYRQCAPWPLTGLIDKYGA